MMIIDDIQERVQQINKWLEDKKKLEGVFGKDILFGSARKHGMTELLKRLRAK